MTALVTSEAQGVLVEVLNPVSGALDSRAPRLEPVKRAVRCTIVARRQRVMHEVGCPHKVAQAEQIEQRIRKLPFLVGATSPDPIMLRSKRSCPKACAHLGDLRQVVRPSAAEVGLSLASRHSTDTRVRGTVWLANSGKSPSPGLRPR